jgi:hypothetical protein
MNFEKFQLLREAKTICDGLEITESEFVKEFSEFPYTASEIQMVKAFPIFENSDGPSKARQVLNFIMGKGSKIKGLGSSLQNAIIAKTTTTYITNDRIKQLDLDTEHASQLRANATAKAKEFAELESRIKDQIDQIADNDPRLQKIASIVKNTASLKASSIKLKFLDGEDLKAEREKQTRLQDKITTAGKELNDEEVAVKAKADKKETPKVVASASPQAAPIAVKPKVEKIEKPEAKSAIDQEIKEKGAEVIELSKKISDIKEKKSKSQGEQFIKDYDRQLTELEDQKLTKDLEYIAAQISKFESEHNTDKTKEWEEKHQKTEEALRKLRDDKETHKKEVIKKSHEIAGLGLSDREKKKKGLID